MHQDKFASAGLLDPERRMEVEAELASKVRLRTADVAVYCTPRPPGWQKVHRYVDEGVAKGPVLSDETKPAHRGIAERHLALWTAYVFVHPNVESQKIEDLKIASEALFNKKNEVYTKHWQRRLFHKF